MRRRPNTSARAFQLLLCSCIWKIWRHNQVLEVIVEAIKTVCSKANARKSVSQRRVYFLREGCSLSKKRCTATKRNILEKTNDWCVTTYLAGLKHYPLFMCLRIAARGQAKHHNPGGINSPLRG